MAESCVIVGIDLASQPRRTAACELVFRGDRLEVRLHPDALNGAARVDDALIKGWLDDERYLLGMDAPFGWPLPFAVAVGGWMDLDRFGDDGVDGATWLAFDCSEDWDDATELLKFRLTDRYVRLYRRRLYEAGGSKIRWPQGLSVSADRIAITAFRAAALLAGARLDRTGRTGRVIEVYPASALAEWELYGGESTVVANTLADAIRNGAKQWGAEAVLCDGFAEHVAASADARDAVTAALTVWASITGYVSPPEDAETPDFLDADLTPAKKRRPIPERRRQESITAQGRTVTIAEVIDAEGWIHHPTAPLTEVTAIDPRRLLTQRLGFA
ncbi:MAG TPA: DUF429 domain-containing protein [Acidimicrobiales bacterium]|nr:DUF429 domain-containing protein [Acidimicrobiales bacterium]